MQTLTARKNFRYACKPIKAGENFDAKDGDVRVLIAVGHAQQRSGPLAEDKPKEPKKPRAKRQYKRRDMTAES